jgi:hypothetical protein
MHDMRAIEILVAHLHLSLLNVKHTIGLSEPLQNIMDQADALIADIKHIEENPE